MAYPIIMTFSQPVRADRYGVMVSGDARVYLSFKNGEWRCTGVEPGGLSASGKTPQEAGFNFRVRLGEVLNDIAELAPTLSEYRSRLAGFLATNRVAAGRWNAALLALRTGGAISDKSVSSLPRKVASERKPIRIEKAVEFPAGREETNLAEPDEMDKAA